MHRLRWNWSEGCDGSPIPFADLVEMYTRAGFLYPAKLQRILPVLDEIEETWQRAQNAADDLLVAVRYGEVPGRFACVAGWRTGSRGWFSQHLVSRSCPIGTVRTMRAMNDWLLHGDTGIGVQQVWFRDENRLPARVFPGAAADLSVVYDLHSWDGVGLDATAGSGAARIDIAECPGSVPPRLVAADGSLEAWLRLEGLDSDAALAAHRRGDALWRSARLTMSRRVLVATGAEGLAGIALIHRAPLGLNFSFLENRVEVVVPESAAGDDPRAIASRLFRAAHDLVEPSRRRFVPLCVARRPAGGPLLARAPTFRAYRRVAWLGFDGIEQGVRSVSRTYARAPAPGCQGGAAVTSYIMEDPRENQRLAAKVDAPAWVDAYCRSWTEQPAGRLLDLGCGPGTLARALAELLPAMRVTGVDVSSSRLAARAVGGASFLAADARALPFRAGAFDLVFCRLLFQFLADPRAVMAEIARLLRPGGRALVQDLDGQLVWHDGMDPELGRQCAVVQLALQRHGFDPHVGRKLRRLGREAGLACERLDVQPYHLIAGRIDADSEALWRTKLEIALPHIAAALGSTAAARSFVRRYLEHLGDEATLTYSVMFSAYFRRPVPAPP